MKLYRLNINNQISEFLTTREVEDLIAKGYLSPITLCQEKESEMWLTLRELPEFHDLFPDSKEDSFIRTLRSLKESKQKSPQSVSSKIEAKRIQARPILVSKESPKDTPVSDQVSPQNAFPVNSPNSSQELVRVDHDKTKVYSLEEVQRALIEEKEERKNDPLPLFPDYLPPYDDFGDEGGLQRKKKATKKKSVGLFSIILTLVALLILFDDEEKKEVATPDDIISFDLKFPELEKVKDEAASQKLMEAASEQFKLMEFPNLVKAYELYKESYEKNSDQSYALYRLALTGAMLLRYQLKNRYASASTVYKLLQFAGEGREFTNLDLMTAKSFLLFYNEKYSAVKFLLDKYLRINNKFSSLLYSVYLQCLLKLGDLSAAKIIAEKLYELPEKNLYVFRSLLDYEEVQGRYEKYSSLFIEGLKIYQKSLDLMLAALSYSIQSKDFEQSKLILERIENLNFGRSHLLKSQALELKGLYLGATGKPDDAAKQMRMSLEIRDSDQLRSRIAALTPSSNEEKFKDSNQLILESKSAHFLKQSQDEEKNANWDMAIILALKAADAYPSYIPSQVHLARMQAKIGSYIEAMKKLENIRKTDALNSKVNDALILVYAQASHFSKSQDLINLLSQAENYNSYEYCNTLGEYYFLKKDYTKSVLWYDQALKINPTADEISFRMAEIYLAANNFNNAKQLIARSVDLDPSQIKYRLLYSNILYEMDDAETAIGYLRQLEKDFPENPMIWNQIAIFYYRSGQIKDFNELHQKMKLVGGDLSYLYKFLLSVAEKENLSQEYIDNANEYLKLNPGDLVVRMGLVERRIDLKKYEEAAKDLDYIQARVESYPRINYFRGLLLIQNGDPDGALAYLKKEVEQYPDQESSRILLAQIYLTKGQLNDSEKWYKSVQSQFPKSVEALKGLAFIKFKRGEFEPAISIYKKVIKLRPDDASVYLILGDIYKNLGQFKDAKEAYKIYLEIDPDSEMSLKVREEFNKINK
ncbi:MAG: tetratricopeptide repeat protein [Bacteriovoracaceae bacterium]|nr:tetratricopeptide repeat protein [Bacteriovoracaceae bacterium]